MKKVHGLLKDIPFDLTQKDKHLFIDQKKTALEKVFIQGIPYGILELERSIIALIQYYQTNGALRDPEKHKFLFETIEPSLMRSIQTSMKTLKNERTRLYQSSYGEKASNHPDILTWFMGSYFTTGSFIFRDFNREFSCYDIKEKKKRIKYKFKEGVESLLPEEKELFWNRSQIGERQISTDNLYQIMGYNEYEFDKNDFNAVSKDLEITVAYSTVQLPKPLTLLGFEQDVLRERLNYDETDDNIHLIRFEKIEVPWETPWIITDIDNFMKNKGGGFYEVPSKGRLRHLADLSVDSGRRE